MTYTGSDLSANEIAWAALDKPFLSNNALYTVLDEVKWVRGTRSGSVASSDESSTTFPARHLYDGFPGNLSKPNNSEQDFTIVIDCSSNPITFDWFGMMNHNLDTLGATICDVQIADTSNFATNLITLSQTNIATSFTKDRRFTDLVLESGGGTARRYSDVEYVRIGIQIPVADVPYIGQLVFGRRRQQQYQPELEWDPTNQVSDMRDTVTSNGVTNRLTKTKGQRLIEGARFLHDTQALQDELATFWTDIEASEQPFFFLDQPNAAPNDFWMLFHEPMLKNPYVQWLTREYLLNAAEQGVPFFSQE